MSIYFLMLSANSLMISNSSWFAFDVKYRRNDIITYKILQILGYIQIHGLTVSEYSIKFSTVNNCAYLSKLKLNFETGNGTCKSAHIWSWSTSFNGYFLHRKIAISMLFADVRVDVGDNFGMLMADLRSHQHLKTLAIIKSPSSQSHHNHR